MTMTDAQRAVMVAAFMAATTPAIAQPSCGPHDPAVAHLATEYGETRRAIALDSASRVIEIFASEGGSWTVLMTTANGIACIVAHGQNFEATHDALPPEGDKL